MVALGRVVYTLFPLLKFKSTENIFRNIESHSTPMLRYHCSFLQALIGFPVFYFLYSSSYFSIELFAVLLHRLGGIRNILLEIIFFSTPFQLLQLI